MSFISECQQSLYQRVFRTIQVPSELDSVLSVDTDNEVSPQSVDLEPGAVDAIWSACTELYSSGVYPMLSLCVRRGGKIVLNRVLGHADDQRLATLQTPICLYSASKAVTAVLMHKLAEDGHVNLLDPVSYYIPAFASKGKGSISILQLLAHRGGIPSVPPDIEPEILFDHKGAMKLICDAEPDDHQGRVQAYHAVTSGFIFNELIRVTTGLNAQQYLDRTIRKPMGMRYFRYGLTKRDAEHAAVNSISGLDLGIINKGLESILGTDPETAIELTNDARFYKAIIPSANLFGTAEEVSRFFQMLLNHGEWQGKQILQALTVHRATRSMNKTELDKSLMMPMRYSAGFMLGGAPVGIYGLNTEYAYGHLGFANIFCWADPQRDIAVSLMNTGKPALGPHIKSLPALLGTISSECSPVVDMDSDIPIYQRG